MTDEDPTSAIRVATIQLVTAYLSSSEDNLSVAGFQGLIRDTFVTLASLSATGQAEPGDNDDGSLRKSKADIRRSIGPDALMSFEDGKWYRSLKRHLTARGITMNEYRARYGLPPDYPSVHPTYSAQRAEIAKSFGLGALGRHTKGAAGKKSRGSGAKGSPPD